jgi:hypothetical protein
MTTSTVDLMDQDQDTQDTTHEDAILAEFISTDSYWGQWVRDESSVYQDDPTGGQASAY